MSINKLIIFSLLFLFGKSLADASLVSQNAKICLLIHSNFNRSAICKVLKAEGYTNVVDDIVPIDELTQFFVAEKPDFIIMDATGLSSVEMLTYESKVLALAAHTHVEKLLCLSQFNVYGDKTLPPFKEESLKAQNISKLTDPYAISKFSSFQQCRSLNDPEKPRFIFCPYPWLYGPKDPAFTATSKNPLYQMAHRVCSAKKEERTFTVIQNDGTARYETLFINDFAKAVICVLKSTISYETVNLSTGRDLDVVHLSREIHNVSGYRGEVILDINCYDEVPRQLLDGSRLAGLGFTATTPLHIGLNETLF